MSKKLDKIITNAIMLSIKITCCCPYVARTELHVMQSVFVLHAAAAAAAAFQSNHSTSHAVAHSFPVALVTQPHTHTDTEPIAAGKQTAIHGCSSNIAAVIIISHSHSHSQSRGSTRRRSTTFPYSHIFG